MPPSQEPIFQKYLIGAGALMRGMVSCTGSQFCGIAMIETKNRAMEVVQKLESQLDIPKVVRMHWTGCPNSCGQVRAPPAAPSWVGGTTERDLKGLGLPINDLFRLPTRERCHIIW